MAFGICFFYLYRRESLSWLFKYNISIGCYFKIGNNGDS